MTDAGARHDQWPSRGLAAVGAGLLLACAPSASPAEAPESGPEVTLELWGQQTAGGARLGLRHNVPAGWHIYLENPGDSGMATSATLQLPPGWSAGPLQFPAPSAFGDEIVGYGYTGEVVFLVDLSGASAGPTAPVTVTSRWLACDAICVPGSATARLDLATLPALSPSLEQAASLLPVAPGPQDHVAVALDGTHLSVTVGGARAARLFPSVGLEQALGGQRPPFLREEIVNGEANLVLRAHLSGPRTGEDLRGVLVLDRAERPGAFLIRVPAPAPQETP